MGQLTSFAGDVFREWKSDQVMRRSAAVAFYSVFSLPSFILVVLSLVARTIGQEAVDDEIFGVLRQYIGPHTVELLQDVLVNLQQNTAGQGWAAIVGLVVLLFVGAGVIRELQTALNIILESTGAKYSLMESVWNFILSFLLLVLAAGVLVFSIVSNAILGTLGERVTDFVNIPFDTIGLIQNSVTYLTVAVLFFLLYSILPARKFPPLIVALCAIIASSILVSCTVIVSYYISKAELGAAYGVAASVLILLFWIYIAANVFLLGAELIDVTTDATKKRTKGPIGLFRRILRK